MNRPVAAALTAILFTTTPAAARAQLRSGASVMAAAPAIQAYAREHGFSGTVLVEQRGRTVFRGDSRVTSVSRRTTRP